MATEGEIVLPEREDGEPEADLIVERRGGCICVKSASPYSGDVQALLREWNYQGFRRVSGKLAHLWGFLFVVCPDWGHELALLEEMGVNE